jgi:tetratricopeptide (TPR) repeat protein
MIEMIRRQFWLPFAIVIAILAMLFANSAREENSSYTRWDEDIHSESRVVDNDTEGTEAIAVEEEQAADDAAPDMEVDPGLELSSNSDSNDAEVVDSNGVDAAEEIQLNLPETQLPSGNDDTSEDLAGNFASQSTTLAPPLHDTIPESQLASRNGRQDSVASPSVDIRSTQNQSVDNQDNSQPKMESPLTPSLAMNGHVRASQKSTSENLSASILHRRVESATELRETIDRELEANSLSASQTDLADNSTASANLTLEAPMTTTESTEAPTISGATNETTKNIDGQVSPVSAAGSDSATKTMPASVWELQTPLALSEATQRQLVERNEYGVSLARRGALASAETEFIQSLRLIADSLDSQAHVNLHSQALSAAWAALNEADDFFNLSLRRDLSTVNISALVAGHETPVLKDVDTMHVPAIDAEQAYYNYALDRILEAMHGQPAAARPIYSLGKLYTLRAANEQNAMSASAKAMFMFHTAMELNPNDHLSANELGVLLSKQNHLDQAKRLFQRSLTINSNVTAWQNLAKVHTLLGETDLAKRAQNEIDLLTRTAKPTADVDGVAWVDAKTFDRVTGEMADHAQIPAAVTAQAKQDESSSNQPTTQPATVRSTTPKWQFWKR